MGFREKGEEDLLSRYRLIWDDVRYEPGEITVIAYNENNFEAERKTIRTAGKPYRIELVPSRDSLIADGKDLLYVTVRIVDRDGNLCPLDTRKVRWTVQGRGQRRPHLPGVLPESGDERIQRYAHRHRPERQDSRSDNPDSQGKGP